MRKEIFGVTQREVRAKLFFSFRGFAMLRAFFPWASRFQFLQSATTSYFIEAYFFSPPTLTSLPPLLPPFFS
jgi:hypothetical protein